MVVGKLEFFSYTTVYIYSIYIMIRPSLTAIHSLIEGVLSLYFRVRCTVYRIHGDHVVPRYHSIVLVR